MYTALYLRYLIVKCLKMIRQISDRKYLSYVQKQTKWKAQNRIIFYQLLRENENTIEKWAKGIVQITQ